jgi:formate hydrogenlyase subunit 4
LAVARYSNAVAAAAAVLLAALVVHPLVVLVEQTLPVHQLQQTQQAVVVAVHLTS